MELDELKSIWKNNAPGFPSKDENEIALMLKGQSRSIIDNLKRSVWFELIFTIVAAMAMLIYALTLPSGALKWTSVSALILFVAYLFYYAKKLTLLNKFGLANENIKSNLELLVNNLDSYLKFYRRSYAILYPLYFFLMLLFIGLERGADEFIAAITKPEKIVMLILLAVFFFFCSTWLANWYLKKLYGNHLEKLKGLLRDLEQQS
jgi:hypothetical protein